MVVLFALASPDARSANRNQLKAIAPAAGGHPLRVAWAFHQPEVFDPDAPDDRWNSERDFHPGRRHFLRGLAQRREPGAPAARLRQSDAFQPIPRRHCLYPATPAALRDRSEFVSDAVHCRVQRPACALPRQLVFPSFLWEQQLWLAAPRLCARCDHRRCGDHQQRKRA
jgi:hypothetical protein